MNIVHQSTAPRANGAWCRVFKITGLMKILGGLLILAASGPVVQAISVTQGTSVTLAWNQSTDPLVVGYNIYYGGASGVYTNKISTGNTTSATIPGLIPGITYYFVATAYNAMDLESPLSDEVAYTAPVSGLVSRIIPGGQVALTLTGPVGHAYDIQASQDLKTWTLIGTVTIGATGTLDFVDPNAANYSWRFYRTRG